MNRIILIGNGFDKGISLPTLYSDFMEWLINDIVKNVNNKIEKEIKLIGFENHILTKIKNRSIANDYSDGFIICNTIDFSICTKDSFFDKIKKGIKYYSYMPDTDNFTDLKTSIVVTEYDYSNFINSKIRIENIILQQLIQDYNVNNNWGNIEQIFYNQLIKTTDDDIKKLNTDFLIFIKKLEEYLKTIDIKSIIDSKSVDYINYIKENIYSDCLKPSQFCPTSIKEKLIEFKTNFIQNTPEAKRLLRKAINYNGSFYNNDFIDYIINNDIELKLLSDHFGINNYLFLNFNYTDTPTYFINKEKNNTFLSIHGDLTDNLNSPIIFGFGDELDKNYKVLEDKNNNEFLKHIKSINYLQNNSYRKLIEFLESDQFQVFIFGHSCGTSDRTLLNTIFEHDNCISIVPFIRADRDNYQDTVMNIYRNFTDKRKLRKRVVNKELCKKLTLDER